MLKSLPLLLAPLIFVAGCATQKPVQPLPVSCPAPPQLPPLVKLPESVTGPSFLDRLDTMLFQKPSAQTKSDFSLRPANGSMKAPGQR